MTMFAQKRKASLSLEQDISRPSKKRRISPFVSENNSLEVENNSLEVENNSLEVENNSLFAVENEMREPFKIFEKTLVVENKLPQNRLEMIDNSECPVETIEKAQFTFQFWKQLTRSRKQLTRTRTKTTRSKTNNSNLLKFLKTHSWLKTTHSWSKINLPWLKTTHSSCSTNLLQVTSSDVTFLTMSEDHEDWDPRTLLRGCEGHV